ncbi:hypothetical protein GIB67_043079 [Kingdonia uniflora]|uniref:DUF1985 domain-containing protein n=1 Tax=Kingdonia uniflora TaxID=39325 RepID=A0A7J7MA10_9MAGN|nr:hypothetical protein GIB67_043079 [Kingdonia uniflora]
MKSIHVCQILGLRVSPIINDFLFADPEHMANFRMRRFPKNKNTYGLKEIDDALKQAKLERHQEDVLRLNLLKIILYFLLLNKGRNVWVKYVDLVDDLQQFNIFPWGEKSIISCGGKLWSLPNIDMPLIKNRIKLYHSTDVPGC